MPTISLWMYDKPLDRETVVKALDGVRLTKSHFTAKLSKYCQDEVFITYWYYEPIEKLLTRVLEFPELQEVTQFLKLKGKTAIKKAVYVFINTKLHTVEIYTGIPKLVREITEFLEKVLGINLVWLIHEDKETVTPNIRYLSSNRGYSVTLYKNKLKFNSPKDFTWRPRYEIRQIVQQLATKGRLE